MSRTSLARRKPTRPHVEVWGTCRRCLEPHWTLTTTRRIPEHSVPGVGPGRPQCLGSRKCPVPGTVEPVKSCFNASGNYAVIQQGAAA